MTQPLTTAQLQTIYNLAVGVTEGYKAPYKLVDIWPAYQASVTSATRQNTLGLTLLKGKTYDEIKAARSEVGPDGQPTATAIEANKLFDSVNKSLGASGYSFSLGQLDLGQRGLDKASKYGVDPADLVSPTETLSDYIARQVNAANPGLNLTGSDLRTKLTDLKVDDTKALSSDKVAALNAWLSGTAGSSFVDGVDASIKNETVNAVKADLDVLAARGWATSDLYSAAAYLMKSYNQSKTAFTGTSTKDGQTDYLDDPNATLDGLHTFTTGLRNATLDPGKAEAAAQVLGALATSDTFGDLWGKIVNTASNTSPGMYADPAVKTVFDLMAGGNGKQFAASVRAVDDTNQVSPLLFNTDKGLAIADTENRRIFVPEGGGKYTVMEQANDGSLTVTKGQSLTFKAVADGSDYRLTDNTGRSLGTISDGQIGVVGANGKTQYVDIPTGSDLGNGELATIGRWLGSSDPKASTAAAKSLMKDFDWPAGSYDLTDGDGTALGSKTLIETTKPKVPTAGFKKVSDDLTDEGRDDGNVDVVVASVGSDGERILERTDTDPSTGATEYRRLTVDSQGNAVGFFLRVDYADGSFEELDNRYTPGDGGPTLVSQSYTNGSLETGQASKTVDTYVFGGPLRVEYIGNDTDGFTAVAANDSRGALGIDAVAMLNRTDITAEGLLSGRFPASATEALVTIGSRVNMTERSGDLIEGDGTSLVRTGQDTFEVKEQTSAPDGSVSNSTTEWTSDGSRVEVKDGSGSVVVVTDTHVDDKGIATTTTTYPDGHIVSERRDPSGQLIGTQESGQSGDSVVSRNYDADHTLQSTTVSKGYADGSSESTTTYADGASVHLTYDPEGHVASSTGTAAPLQTLGTAIQDINSLVQAIRGGQPLPVFNSGLHLLNDLSNPVVNGTQVLNNQPLFTTTAVVGAIGSLYGLYQAFDHGTALDQISAGASALVAVNSAANAVANQMAGQAAGAIANEALNSAANTIGQAVPFLSAAVSLEHGDYAGAAVAVASYFVPVVGWIYAAYSLITGLGEEPPEAWGTARFKFTDGTSVGVATDGESIGLGKVQVLTQGNGESPTNPDGTRNPNYFGGLLGYLDDVIDRSAHANPNVPLGIIPQRLPTLTWHEARQANPGYSLVDIDPVTGEERYPGLRYNDDFTPINADATDPAQRRDVFQRMVDSALEHHAIAPMWEVQTAKMQQDIGDPDAGLTEEERAAHHGLSAAADASGHRLPGKFRPVVLDLNGDGTITTVSDAASNVGFDWDDSGYIKQTGWVGSGEGFLVLDRNLNGTVDEGSELFSNSLVADAAKGVRSLVNVDANADGVIDASDPVYAALRVWQDANQNGAQDAGETHTLADLGITKLDYGSGRFTRNGQDFALQSPDIEASNDGVRVNVVQGGIQVDYSDGRSTLIVTQVTDLGGGTGQGTGFVARDDGITSWEDGVSPGNPSDSGYPHAQQPSANQPISIPLSQLLANDAFNGSNSGLTITAVGSGEHGSAVINATQGTVEFTPEHNYAGQASFEYTVTATDGQTRTAHAIIDLQAVNDAPSVTTTLDQRIVYGYGVYAHSETVFAGGENGPETRVTVERDKGIPMYSPYNTVAGQTMTWVSEGEGGYYAFGPVVDTGIPKDYFDHEYSLIARQQSGGEDGGTPAGIKIVMDGQTYLIPATPSLYLHATPVGSETSNDGKVTASDPDGSQFRYELYQDALYGHAAIDASTGQFTYTGKRYVDQNLFGELVATNVDTDDHTRYEETHPDVFQVKVTDLSDPTGNTFTIQDVTVTHFGPLPNPNVASGGGKKPIAVDLNGDGFHFTDVDDSNVFFDVNGDGWRRKIAWNNPDDGFIAYDKNGDGKIDRFDELSFVPYKPDGQTDLEGLKAFDTNGDGVFSALDDKWASFGIWRDANSNGVTDPGEFKTLSDMGIDHVALTSDGHFQVVNGQSVHGIGTATKSDGSTLALADVTLQYKNVTQVTTSSGTTTASVPVYTQGQVFTGTADADLVLGTSGSDQYHLGAGNDVVNDDGGDDLVDAGSGDDVVFTGAGKDYVDAGDGNDTAFTGDGDDLALGAGGDDFLSMGAGNDVAFGGDGNDMLSGGTGNDLLSGDAGDDKLFGEGGRDVLFGMDGDDELWGGDGDDVLHGGAGNDLLAGGAGDDAMDGGAGNDTYDVDSAGDTIVENPNEGFDTVRSSIDYTLGTELENLTLTGTAALQGTGNAADNVLIGNEANNTLRGLDGNDTLDGGQGADTLIGGTGDDTYVIDNAGDTVVELQGEGVDTVRSRITTTLGDNVENLTLIGINAINGGGNALDNVIVGNDASNVIDGGTGADEMRGGAGNDTYIVDNQGDRVVETVDADYDTVVVNGLMSYTLTDNVEALQLGDGVQDGTGNALDNVLIGNEGNNRLDGGLGADMMSGGAGDDSYVVDSAGDRVIEAADGGFDRVSASIDYVLPDNVEQLSLTGTAVRGTGNPLNNFLFGNDHANVLDGGAGADTMTAGTGDDTYIVDNAGDVVVEAAGEGTDTELSSVTRTLDANVENLTLTGTSDIDATGDTLDNVLTGNVGSNRLDGGLGADTMAGGAGDDNYVVDNTGDQVIEAANAGFDRVSASIDYVLPDNVEQLTLTGTAIHGTGNTLNNILFGNAQANILDGGAGADTMTAGSGDDTYFVDDAGDVVVEAAGEGTDTELSSVTRTLDANVENLTLTGTSDLDASGNALDNVLTGNAGSNRLDGGLGADTMAGGAGDDSYVVDDTGDQVIEAANAGFDRVSSSIDYVLPDSVEQLTLTGTAMRGTGNTLDNFLFGNDQANILDGAAGADTMAGGAGDDRYRVDNTGDVIVEAAGDGIDTVVATVNYALAADVEHLVLSGTQAISGTGNELDNVLVGNSAGNVLSAGAGNDVLAGGRGDDTLDGGTGDDLYLYFQGDGHDRIVDASGTDTLRFGPGMTLDSVAARQVQVDGQTKVVISVLGTDGQETSAGVEFALGSDGSSPIERFEFANGQTAALSQLLITTRTQYGTNGSDTMTGDRNDDIIDASNGNDTVYGRWGNDTLYGNNGKDKLFGEGGNDKLYGGANDDQLWGGAGDDYLDGGDGADLLVGGAGNDQLWAGNDSDKLDGGDGNDYLDGANGEDELYAGNGDDTLDGGNDTDLLAGGAGNDVLRSGNGLDVVIAGAGNDSIDTGNDGDFIDAGAGDDVINAGSGADFIAGGRGNDTIDAGQDYDVIAFNRGDGADTVLTSSWQRDTLSLGGGVRYADLSLRKDGNNLVLDMGQGDSITFQDWYADGTRRNLTTLQVVTGAAGGDYDAASSDRLHNRKTVSFDFEQLANRFDQVRAADPSLSSWRVAGALDTYYQRGSDTQAIGGDLAYRYATLGANGSGSYGDLDWRAVRSRMGSLSGTNWQNVTTSTTIDPWTALQAGVSLIEDQTAGLPSPITPAASPSADELVFAAINAGGHKPSWMGTQPAPVLP